MQDKAWWLRLAMIVGGAIIAALAQTLIADPATSPNYSHATMATMVLWACIVGVLAAFLYVAITKILG